MPNVNEIENLRRLAEGYEKFDEWFGVYPLLVFPLRFYDHKKQQMWCPSDKVNHSKIVDAAHVKNELLLPNKNYGIWVDVGAYGAPRKIKEGKNWDAKSNIREMEHWTRDVGGWQAAYTDIFATKKEYYTNYSALNIYSALET